MNGSKYYWGIILRLIIYFLPTLLMACGLKTENSDFAAITNHSANAIVDQLQCGKRDSLTGSGKFNPTMTSLVPAAAVVKFDNAIPKARQDQLIHYVQSALTAVPQPVQEFFIHFNGVIRITPDLEGQCDQSAIAAMREKQLDGKTRLDSCYRFLKHKSLMVSGLSLYVRDNVTAIGHGTVRGFGFILADFFSHVALANGEAQYHRSMLPSMQNRLSSLHRTYSQELQQNASWSGSNPGSPLEVFAEGYDSLYCNTWAQHDHHIVSRIKNERLTADQIASIFTNQRNTQLNFKSLFSQTFTGALTLVDSIHQTIANFMRQVKGPKSLGLVSADPNSIVEPPKDIAGETVLATDSPRFDLPSQNRDIFGSADNNSQQNSQPQPDPKPFGDLGNINYEDLQIDNSQSIFTDPKPENDNNALGNLSPQPDPDRPIIIINNNPGGTINIFQNDKPDNPQISQPDIPDVPWINDPNTPNNNGWIDENNLLNNDPPQDISGPQTQPDPQSTPDPPQLENDHSDVTDWHSFSQRISESINQFVQWESNRIQQQDSWVLPQQSSSGTYIQSLSNYGSFYH